MKKQDFSKGPCVPFKKSFTDLEFLQKSVQKSVSKLDEFIPPFLIFFFFFY